MLRSKRILLVDDDQLNNLINSRIITKFTDFTVESFTSGKDGLKYLSTCDPESFPEVIFLDINMPVMDGWEFLEEYEKIHETLQPKCNVIMLTSSIDFTDIEKSRKYKTVKEFMSKPLTLESLKVVASMSSLSA